jgi:chromosomal replication initiator protein
MRETEKYFHLKRGSLVEQNRRRMTNNARAVAMYLARNLCHLTYIEIGEYFERNHKSVINNCNKIVKLLHEDREHYISHGTIELIDKIKCMENI